MEACHGEQPESPRIRAIDPPICTELFMIVHKAADQGYLYKAGRLDSNI